VTLAIPEHPDGGLVADPWEGVTVRVRFHPPLRMSYADIQRRAPGWPQRRAMLAEHRRQVGAVQVEMFAGTSPAAHSGGG
jgi:hypothetical protein